MNSFDTLYTIILTIGGLFLAIVGSLATIAAIFEPTIISGHLIIPGIVCLFISLCCFATAGELMD